MAALLIARVSYVNTTYVVLSYRIIYICILSLLYFWLVCMMVAGFCYLYCSCTLMNAMPILPKQIPCVCIMYYMANKDDSDSELRIKTMEPIARSQRMFAASNETTWQCVQQEAG